MTIKKVHCAIGIRFQITSSRPAAAVKDSHKKMMGDGRRAKFAENLHAFPFNKLKGHGNEADFLGFLQKLGPHRSPIVPFELFRFWLRICGDIRNRKTTPRLSESASRRLSDSGSRGAADSPTRRVGESTTRRLGESGSRLLNV